MASGMVAVSAAEALQETGFGQRAAGRRQRGSGFGVASAVWDGGRPGIDSLRRSGVESGTEERMPEVQRDDVTIYYEDEGDGQPLLLIHGHTLDHRVWDDLRPRLLAAGLRPIRPDLRGHGRSSRPPCGYHWQHHGLDMAAVLDAAGVEAAPVVGFSLGGGIALELAITMSERLTALVLVSPVMPDRPFEAEFMANLKAVAKSARSEGIAAAMAGPWLDSPLFAASFEKAGVRQRTAEIVRDFPGAEYLASERDQVARQWQMPQRLAEIAVPTMVVAGGRDLPGFTAFAREAAEGISGARSTVLEEAGHLLPLEAPDELAAAILEHLRVGTHNQT
jgi:pimeloyl-ACP methyl ester carboxylesterase